MEEQQRTAPPPGQPHRANEPCPVTFRSAWRPALGWVCVLASAWNFVVAPTVIAAAELVGRPLGVPLVQEDVLFELLALTLGAGGMRMIEKLKKVASG